MQKVHACPSPRSGCAGRRNGRESLWRSPRARQMQPASIMTGPSLLIATTLLATAACAPRSDRSPLTPRSLSAQDHHAAAAREEREATDHTAAAARLRGREGDPLGCYDAPALTIDPTSGAERLPILRPCWTGLESPSREQERAAAVHRRAAAGHRAQAAALWRAEDAACSSLGEQERTQSPFFHHEDVVAVTPIHRDGRLVGARVRFRRVRGLDGPWMRKAVTCHQARAGALGYVAPSMAYCPLMVAPTSTWIEEDQTTVTVAIEAARPDDAAAILGRARDLLSDRHGAERRGRDMPPRKAVTP